MGYTNVKKCANVSEHSCLARAARYALRAAVQLNARTHAIPAPALAMPRSCRGPGIRARGRGDTVCRRAHSARVPGVRPARHVRHATAVPRAAVQWDAALRPTLVLHPCTGDGARRGQPDVRRAGVPAPDLQARYPVLRAAPGDAPTLRRAGMPAPPRSAEAPLQRARAAERRALPKRRRAAGLAAVVTSYLLCK